jgi:hypothetical protein
MSFAVIPILPTPPSFQNGRLAAVKAHYKGPPCKKQ